MTRFSRLIESIGQQRDKVIEYQTRMTELPALRLSFPAVVVLS